MIRSVNIKSIIIALILVCLIVLPIGWYFAIGPRVLNNSSSPQEQLIYYKFHTYSYVGTDCPDEWGACIRPGVLEGYYKSKNSDEYVIHSVKIDAFVYQKMDETANA